MTEYGPEIAVNGVRPEWLRDGDRVWPKWKGSGYDSVFYNALAKVINEWPDVTHIRLPKEHFAYKLIGMGYNLKPEFFPMTRDEICSTEDRFNVETADWAIKEAQSRCGYDLGLIPNTAIIELARMIQQYEQHRKIVDPDVLAVSEIIRAWDDMPTIDKDGQYFQAALAAYKKHK